jgi:hypothetical protein
MRGEAVRQPDGGCLPSVTYQFRHALAREAILDSLLPRVRAGLAQTALAAAEAAHPGLAGRLRRVATALLVEALALAGRTDECLSARTAALRISAAAGPSARARVHLAVAHAAVETTRWPVAVAPVFPGVSGASSQLCGADTAPARAAK